MFGLILTSTRLRFYRIGSRGDHSCKYEAWKRISQKNDEHFHIHCLGCFIRLSIEIIHRTCTPIWIHFKGFAKNCFRDKTRLWAIHEIGKDLNTIAFVSMFNAILKTGFRCNNFRVCI